MTNAQLEHVVITQARELEAQRRVIERQARQLRKCRQDQERVAGEYRRGYRAGWTAGRRERTAA